MPSVRIDPQLDSLRFGQLILHVTSAKTGAPWHNAIATLESAPTGRVFDGPIIEGRAKLRAIAGRYRLRLRGMGVGPARVDSVTVRRGFSDTLVLIVGQPWLCGL